jgi:hypothetical protein
MQEKAPFEMVKSAMQRESQRVGVVKIGMACHSDQPMVDVVQK